MRAASSPTILQMRSITKEFPGVKARSDVSLTVHAAEIHAICGENGAGKSTLMKALVGFAGLMGASRTELPRSVFGRSYGKSP